MGNRGNGCHALSARSSATLPSEPDRPSDERNQQRLSEQLAQDTSAARAQRQTQRDLPPAVGGARGKQAAEVGAGGQQNQARQQHQPGKKRRIAGAKKLPCMPGRTRE